MTRFWYLYDLVVNDFGIDADQVNLTRGQQLVFNSGEYRCDHMLGRADNSKAKQRSLPKVLMTHLRATGREAVTATLQPFEVYILLEDSAAVSAYTNMQVEVEIHI